MPPELMKAISDLMRNRKTALFGNVLSRLKLVIDVNYEALAAVRSDGCLIYNPQHAWAQNITAGRLKHVLLHEASHILLKHLHRITTKMAKNPNQMKAFNIAADMALEHLLTSVSTDFIPEHHQGLEQFLPKNQWGQPMEKLLGLINQNHPEFQNMPSDIEQLSAAGKKAIQDAVSKSLGKAAGQNTGSGSGAGNSPQAGKSNQTSALLTRVLAQYMNIDNQILAPLKKHFQVTFGDEAKNGVAALLTQRNMLRREFMGLPMLGRNSGAKAVIPKHTEKWHNSVTLLIDVSGSVQSESVQACLRFVQRLTSQFNVFPIRALTFNSSLQQEFEILDSTSVEDVAANIKIGGGTNIRRALVDANVTSKLTLVFTDMMDSAVTISDFNTGTKVVFVAYDDRKTDDFTAFTAGEWVDGDPMVDLFR